MSSVVAREPAMYEYFDVSFFPFFVVPSLFIRKANRQQQLNRIFFQRLTISPETGRRPDYTIFSVDIGVTDVTKNSRLFATSALLLAVLT